MYSRGSAPGPAASAPAGPTAPGGSAAGQQKSSDYGTGYGSYSGYQVTLRRFCDLRLFRLHEMNLRHRLVLVLHSHWRSLIHIYIS